MSRRNQAPKDKKPQRCLQKKVDPHGAFFGICYSGNRCLFAHSLAELRPTPNGLVRSKKNKSIKFRIMKVGNTLPLVTLPATCFYDSLPLSWIHNKRPALCDFFTKFKKCSNWEKCDFLHLPAEEVNALLGDRLCIYHGIYRFPTYCTLNHDMKKLRVPQTFIESISPTGQSIDVLSTCGTVSVPSEYVAPTQGLKKGEETLCEDPTCDKWITCPNLHLVEQYWKDHPTTSLKPHSYLSIPEAPSTSTDSSSAPSSSSSAPPSAPEEPKPHEEHVEPCTLAEEQLSALEVHDSTPEEEN